MIQKITNYLLLYIVYYYKSSHLQLISGKRVSWYFIYIIYKLLHTTLHHACRHLSVYTSLVCSILYYLCLQVWFANCKKFKVSVKRYDSSNERSCWDQIYLNQSLSWKFPRKGETTLKNDLEINYKTYTWTTNILQPLRAHLIFFQEMEFASLFWVMDYLVTEDSVYNT